MDKFGEYSERTELANALRELIEGLDEDEVDPGIEILYDIADELSSETLQTVIDALSEFYDFDEDLVDDEDDDDEEMDESLTEQIDYSIQVVDAKMAISDLKKMGVKAEEVDDDEIAIDLKQKDKVVKWMLSSKGGWDKEDIKDTYPELFESVIAERKITAAERKILNKKAAAREKLGDKVNTMSFKRNFYFDTKLKKYVKRDEPLDASVIKAKAKLFKKIAAKKSTIKARKKTLRQNAN